MSVGQQSFSPDRWPEDWRNALAGTFRRSTARPRWRRVSVSVGLIALGFSTALYADEAGSTKRPASPEDSITAAKRELDVIKAATNPLPDSIGTAGPQISLPELHGTSEPAIVRDDGVVTAQAGAKQSPNWLVDAVMNPKSNPTKGRGREDKRTGPATDEPLGASTKVMAVTGNASDEENSKSGAEAKPGEVVSPRSSDAAVFNPLTKYMADWMTPKDYALLKPGLEKATPDELPQGSGSAASGALDSAEFGALTGVNGGMLDGPKAAAVPTKPEDNPFLAGFRMSDPASINSVPPPASPAPTLPTVTPPSSPPPSDHAIIPDFAKPNSDDKYFKPLKRF